MSLVSLELFKQHVRADDFSDDDTYLGHILEVAEEWVIRQTNRSVPELKDMNGGEFPLTLLQAVMMLAGHWYNQREGVSGVQMHEVPYSLKALVKPWIKLVDDDGRENEVPAEAPQA